MGSREIHILVDEMEIVPDTRVYLDIIKSKVRQEYVRTISIKNIAEIEIAIQADSKFGHIIMVALANTESTALAVKYLCKKGMCMPPCVAGTVEHHIFKLLFEFGSRQ